jgi:hypothetical protein
MPANYLANFQNKELNEIVIPGSHDAGLYGAGKDNIITQKVNVGGQALAGIRFFDLRIATEKSGFGPWATYEQKAYHLKDTMVHDSGHQVRRHLPGGNKNVKSHQNVAHAGGWGGDLTTMLQQAQAFVSNAAYATEFLILKFSKCYNLEQIIESCLQNLGAKWYAPGALTNLNTQQVNALAGRVITLFSEKELGKVSLTKFPRAPGQQYAGCLTFRELYDKKANTTKVYQPNYHGLQYFGKFSSTNNVATNTQKQNALMQLGGAACHPHVLGMMYWTTTAFFENIRQRNKPMWQGANITALQQTWEDGMSTAIQAQMGRDAHRYFTQVTTHGQGFPRANWKFFMPNIVMMDFASDRKCGIVQQLNTVSANEIQDLVQKGWLS